MSTPYLHNYQPANTRKLKDRLKEKIKKLCQGNSPTPSFRVNGHVDKETGHSATTREADGSEGRNPVPMSVPVQHQQDLWQRAFAMLSEQEKKSLSVLANRGQQATQPADDMSSAVPSLLAVAREKQAECEKRFWRINITGKPGDEIILRDQASQVISWLTKAGEIGATFASSVVQPFCRSRLARSTRVRFSHEPVFIAGCQWSWKSLSKVSRIAIPMPF